jgi:hypothetical protein
MGSLTDHIQIVITIFAPKINLLSFLQVLYLQNKGDKNYH